MEKNQPSALVTTMQSLFNSLQRLPDEYEDVVREVIFVLERLSKENVSLMEKLVVTKQAWSDDTQRHNELYLAFVSLLRQLDKEVVVKSEYYRDVLDFREYIIGFEDCPELGGIKLTLKHMSEN